MTAEVIFRDESGNVLSSHTIRPFQKFDVTFPAGQAVQSADGVWVLLGFAYTPDKSIQAAGKEKTE